MGLREFFIENRVSEVNWGFVISLRGTRCDAALSFMHKCHAKPANVENIVQKRHNE